MQRAAVLILALSVLLECKAGPLELILPRLNRQPKCDGILEPDLRHTLREVKLPGPPPLSLRAALGKAGLFFALTTPKKPKPFPVIFTFHVSRIFDSTDRFVIHENRKAELKRHRVAPLPKQSSFSACTKGGDSAFVVELFVPFQTLGADPPKPGKLFFVEVNWAQSRQAELCLFAERANLLRSPDLSNRKYWGFHASDAPLFKRLIESGVPVIRIQTPGRYTTMEQSLSLRPHSLYRLEAEARGETSVYLRARTSKHRGEPTEAYTVWTKPTAKWHRYSVRFPTGETGRALIIVGATERSGKGRVFLRNFRVVEEPFFESAGSRILLSPGSPGLLVEKIPIKDCRALRGFITAPVDGTLSSPRWDAGIWEYNMPGAGAGVGYAYHGNDGLHITLADKKGVDMLLVRGGAHARIYGPCNSYDNPGSAPPLAELPGTASVQRVRFRERIRADRFSFFNVRDGLLADLTFLRFGKVELPSSTRGTGLVVLRETEPPASLARFLRKRYSAEDRKVYKLAASASSLSLHVPAGRTIHLISDQLPYGSALDSLLLELDLSFPGTLCPFTLVLNDPLDPRLELMRADFVLYRPGVVKLILDFPDQMLPKGIPLWLSVSFEAEVSLLSLRAALWEGNPVSVRAEALSHRLLLLRGLFCAASEARPWLRFRRGMDLETFLASQGRYEDLLRELFRPCTYVFHCADKKGSTAS